MPVFSQWLGPRAQRSLCLLFQLEEVVFARVAILLQRLGKRPVRRSDRDPRGLTKPEWEGAPAASHSPRPHLSALEKSLKDSDLQIWGLGFDFL